MNNVKFKKELERVLGISTWRPTDEHIAEIARYIIKNYGVIKSSDIGDISSYVSRICDDITWVGVSVEGFDNSDLNYLLALAIKTVSSGG